jgi:insecticidal toxin complex protein TccC
MTISNRSNRGVLSTLTESPSDVDALFTTGGQQKQLLPEQNLVWALHNVLLKVTPVVRDGDADDRESYRYDAASQRILKVSVQKTGSSTQTQRALYLPGLELRSTKAGGAETERLEVITVGEAGRALHWKSGKPDGIGNDQVRYSYDNLTGSSWTATAALSAWRSTTRTAGQLYGRRAAWWKRTTKPSVIRARSVTRRGCTTTVTGTTSRGRVAG